MKRILYKITQENSIENSVQDSLPYIPRTHGPCEIFLTYPKWPCVSLKANIYVLCGITSSLQNLLYLSMYHVTITVIVSSDVTDV